ncbi:MAG: DUF3943 domain-containing protein [Bacteriovoracia bacterium]
MASSSKYKYQYKDREHSFKESAGLVGILYGVNWIGYYITQPDEVSNHGSFTKYRENFGELQFDMDSAFWNLGVHPLVGGQVFLFYRAHGYSHQSALFMTMIQSTLFEFTVEIYTEPASIQDLYQTPILGSIVGYGLEQLSLKLLHNGTIWGKYLGHLINPWTLFPFFEEKVLITPRFDNGKMSGVSMMMEF